MRQPENPKSPPLTEHQNTVLLSDMPVAPAWRQESQAASSDVAHRPSSQATAVLSQRYDVLAEAGHGSMGSVYKARDRETGEIVALKLLKPEIASDQAMMDRFKNELLFARKITHKNVCRVHEFNRLGGIAYTSMEFVEGESLRSVLNRFGGLPVRKAIDLARQICSGLQEAHAQGIVHRDLKPENVMIDAQGNVKIMDFGIARSMEAGTRLTGSMVGTPAYMAPEQVAGKPVDYRTDVYSLGLILYEVFTGAPAFQAENAVAVALKQMREAPAAPHEIEPSIPVPIERAILKCIEKEPSKRFQTVLDLKNALKTPTNVAPAVPAMAHHSSHEVPFASHPLYGSSALSPARPKRRASVLAWIMVGLLLCGATFAGTRWPEWKQRAQQLLLPPPSPVAPKPPDFALTSSEPTIAPAEPESGTAPADGAGPDVSDTVASPAASTEPARAESKEEKPAANAAASVEAKPLRRVAPTGTEKAEPPSDTQVASSANAPKTPHKASGQARQVLTPVLNDHMASYVWVGRYEREERAQAAAKKIEDLGLPVSVIPRRSAAGAVYVVVTGPFGPDRVTSVIDWLKTQGFLGVRAINNPAQGRQSSDARSAARIGGPEE
ncbi:MAG TPA: protein kinase [Candidatus Acidoferrum sp.]|nr:protein kinase [Candidatus Acidoferrum sp.]